MKDPVYLDYNATAPPRPQVLEVVKDIMAAPYNASSIHNFGRLARKIVEASRLKVADLVSAPPAQVIFGSGATEANNTVLNHFRDERILVSAIEHPSVLEAAPGAERIPVTAEGVLDLGALETLLKKEKTGLVSIMLVNNETGAIQPVAEASGLAKQHGALVHCDAVQAAGRIPVNLAELGIDFLTLSAHKLSGPQGVGALILGGCGITPIMLEGGGQEKKARAGTENIAGIAGFGLAAQLAKEELNGYEARYAPLRDTLRSEIAAIAPETVFYAQNATCVANTLMFSLPGVASETLMMAFDLEGIALSNGSACTSGTVKPSTVLQAMGMGDALTNSALRVSMGWQTSVSDIDRFLEVWSKLYDRMKPKVKTKAHA